MKKEVIFLFLLGIIFISPLVLAQEQVQTYSDFNRFVDGVKMFFSFGDNKVMLALEIREKEVNSAIVNTENEDSKEADKNLEQAWKKLQVIQEKVSLNTAEKVKQNSNEIINIINQEENLPETFEVYTLEEEKTGLTAEWVIEVNGLEGQTLTPEIVVNKSVEQNRIMEIENKIDKIDNEISNWVVEHTYAEGTTAGGEAGVIVEGGLAKVVKTEVANGDNGLKPEVKTSVAIDDKTNKNKVSGDKEGGYAPSTTAGGAPSDTIEPGTVDDESVNNGDCGEGVVCGGEDDVIEGGEGGPGENDLAHSTDFNEGDSPSDDGSEISGDSNTESSSGGGESITGESIKEIKSEDNFLIKFFKDIFGK